jgi:hypothetical protein
MTEGPINFLYWSMSPSSPGAGGVYNFANTILFPSSNMTLAPFNNPLKPVEKLVAGKLRKPKSRTCDEKGRWVS